MSLRTGWRRQFGIEVYPDTPRGRKDRALAQQTALAEGRQLRINTLTEELKRARRQADQIKRIVQDQREASDRVWVAKVSTETETKLDAALRGGTWLKRRLDEREELLNEAARVIDGFRDSRWADGTVGTPELWDLAAKFLGNYETRRQS